MALRAVHRNEATVTLVVRLTARLWLLVGTWGWADTPLRWALLALCVVHDLWLWSRLRAGRGPGVRWRVAADLVDATVWSLLGWAHYPHTAAVMVVIPLVAFVSARRLSTGLVLTAVTIGVTAAARSLVGSEPYLVVTTGFVLIGVLLGRSLVWLVAEEVRRHEALVERSAQASLAAARLAGRNAVVTGVGAEAIDQLQVTIFALGGAGVDEATELRKVVSQHKQQLGRATRAEAYYLRDACDVYSQATRSSEPDASRFTFFDVDPSAGTVVVSRSQARLLWQHLAGRGGGVVRVRSATVGPNGEVSVQVDDETVVLPAVDGQPLSLSVMAAGVAAMAAYVLILAVPQHSVVPAAIALPVAALLLLSTVVAHRVLRRWGPPGNPWWP